MSRTLWCKSFAAVVAGLWMTLAGCSGDEPTSGIGSAGSAGATGGHGGTSGAAGTLSGGSAGSAGTSAGGAGGEAGADAGGNAGSAGTSAGGAGGGAGSDDDSGVDADDSSVSDTTPEAEAGVDSIAAIRDPSNPNHPAINTEVKIAGVYVTALRPDSGSTRGFYVQDDSLLPFTGIFVFTGATSPTVTVGNRVTVTGTYIEFNGVSEINLTNLVVVDPGTTLPFAPIAIADPSTIATGGVQSEGYESMLLEVDNVVVTIVNPDAPQDFDEFAVTGNLRIDDQLYPFLDNTYPLGSSFTSIIGILGFQFANDKLEPRDAADLAAP